MAFLYQPPKLPYSGTELGLGSNVFCENLSMIGGSATALGADLTPVTTTTASAADDYTSNAVTSSSVDPAGGTGMSAKFSFTSDGGGGPYALTLSIENPGIGYKVGDKVTFTAAAIKIGLDAVTPAANTVNQDAVFVLLADEDVGVTDKSYIVGYSVDDNTTEGWQFLLDAPSGEFQRIVISAPSKKASADITDLERTTTVHANATSTDNGAVPDLALGGVCSTAISRNGNTHLNITVVRFVPTGFTLNDCAMTVRLGDRQLATTA